MEYCDAYYELSRLLHIACTLSLTSADAERSFSCLELVVTHLRTVMLDARLSLVSVLSMYSVRANTLDMERILIC